MKIHPNIQLSFYVCLLPKHVCDFLCFHFLLGKIGTIFTPRAEVTNIRSALLLKLLRLEQRSAGSLSALVNKVLLEYSYYVLSGCLCTARAELSSCSTDWLTKPEIFTA